MNKPARLGKDDNVHLYNHSALEEWLLSHSLLCLIILTAILTALFVMVCWAICGVSAVESGTQYRMETWI